MIFKMVVIKPYKNPRRMKRKELTWRVNVQLEEILMP